MEKIMSVDGTVGLGATMKPLMDGEDVDCLLKEMAQIMGYTLVESPKY